VSNHVFRPCFELFGRNFGKTVPVDGGQAGRQLDPLGSLAVNLCPDYVAFQRVHPVWRFGCTIYKNLNKLAGRNLRKINV
jgi:hypothetical protein